MAALYNGYTERDFDKEAAMVSFKEAERYGELAGDSLTMARAEYQIGKMLFDDYSENEALSLFKKADSLFGNHITEFECDLETVVRWQDRIIPHHGFRFDQ